MGPDTVAMNIHVLNVSEFQYNPISYMSLDAKNQRLAVFRSGDCPTIEIWNLSNQPFLSCSIHDLESVNGKVSVESLSWAQGRLFSCGLHGFIIEHDLVSRCMKRKYCATSGPVWNIAANPSETLLGAVTEDGFVNIFEILDEEIQFRKVLDRQEGRILCLAWSPCERYVATGSVDNVRLWDVERGRAIQRLTTGRSKKNETIVWCVQIIDQLTIISGDSRGVVSFWDGNIGVLKFKITTHRADILSMCVSPDQSIVYVGGVDPSIVLLQRVGKAGEKWVKSHQRMLHTNDVTSLQSFGVHLLSGGLDCELTMSTPPQGQHKQIIRKYPPLSKSPAIFLSTQSQRLLVKEARGISLWKLPNDSRSLVKLLDFRSSGNQIVLSCALGETGQYMAYSTSKKVHYFRLATLQDDSVVPIRLKNKHTTALSGKAEPEAQEWLCTFLNENHVLAMPADGSVIRIVELNHQDDSYRLVSEIDGADFVENSGLRLLSARNNYAAVSTQAGEVIILQFGDDHKLVQAVNLPKYSHETTSLLFHPNFPYLLLTFVDHTFRLYNYQTRRIDVHDSVGWCRKSQVKRKHPSARKDAMNRSADGREILCQQPILSSCWSSDGAVVLLREVNKVHFVELDINAIRACGDAARFTKQPKLVGSSVRQSLKNSTTSPNESDDSHEPNTFILNQKTLDCDKNCKYVSHIEFFGEKDELLLVEVKPTSLLSKLPPAFARKRFGM